MGALNSLCLAPGGSPAEDCQRGPQVVNRIRIFLTGKPGSLIELQAGFSRRDDVFDESAVGFLPSLAPAERSVLPGNRKAIAKGMATRWATIGI